MNENSMSGTNGEAIQEETKRRAQEVKERLRSAGTTATEAVRGRATRAQHWARSQWGDLQQRVESDPYTASAWALGIGFIAGVLLASLMRGRD